MEEPSKRLIHSGAAGSSAVASAADAGALSGPEWQEYRAKEDAIAVNRIIGICFKVVCFLIIILGDKQESSWT